jgi:hypothetical protein
MPTALFFTLFALVTAAVAFNPRDACSGNGIVQPDTLSLFSPSANRCECHQCFQGNTCDTFNNSLCWPIEVDVATDVMAAYWEDHDDITLDLSIPNWYRAEYQAPTVFPAFLSGQNGVTYEAIQKLHAKVGNADTSNKNVFLGDGASQVIRLLIASIAKKEGRPMKVRCSVNVLPNQFNFPGLVLFYFHNKYAFLLLDILFQKVIARAPYYPNMVKWANENPLRRYYSGQSIIPIVILVLESLNLYDQMFSTQRLERFTAHACQRRH